ncbi:MAG: 7TM-DISM domain-containing protein [Candidatus Sericytochromatia bacterium]
MKKLICFIFIYFLTILNSNAYSTTLTDENNVYTQLDNIEYLEDKTNQLNIDDITTKYKNQFISKSYKDLNFGFSKSAHWLKLNINNQSEQTEWYIDIGFPKLNSVNLFIRDNNKFIIKNSGTYLDPNLREINTRKIVFNLQIKKNEFKTFYLKIYSPHSPVQAPLSLINKNTFWENSLIQESFYMFLFGVFFVMILYNLVIFSVFREKIYLYYSFFNYFLLMIQVSTNAYGYYYIWGNVFFEIISPLFFANFLSITFITFLIYFLDITKEYKSFYILSFLRILNTISIILLLLKSSIGIFNIVSTIIQTIIVLSIVIKFSLKSNNTHTKILFSSWIIVSASGLIFIFNRLGIIEKSFLTDNSMLITGAMSSIVISLALAKKFQIYRFQKEQYFTELEDANKKLLIYKNHLEDLVNEKTNQLQKSKDLAESMAKAKSDFLASMSHDIRTPINGVMGMTELLSMTNLDNEQKSLVNTISSSSEILLSLVNDILDISKFESGKMELEQKEFNLKENIEEVIDILSLNAQEKGIEIFYYISTKVPEIIISDSIKLKRVLINLISNSIKFTEKGYILLEVTLNELDNIADIDFIVKDTGIGIPEDKKDKLFKPFTQVDSSITNKFGGTGLGLTISKNIVESMNGNIGFKNNDDSEGATFNFNIKVSYIKNNAENQIYEKLKSKRLYVYSDNEDFKFIINKSSSEININTSNSDNKYFNYVIEKYCKDIDVSIFNSNNTLSNEYDFYVVYSNKKDLEIYNHRPLIVYGTNEELIDKEQVFYLQKPLKLKNFYNLLIDILDNKVVKEKKVDKIFPKISNKENNINTNDLRILVAEDNLVNQKLIEKVFDKIGYKIDLVSNGVEAVNICKEKEYDLILMDVQMPEMDGIEATKQIKLNLLEKTPKIVALTANVLQEQKDACYNAGMSDFLTKPFKINDIKSLVLSLTNE